VYVLPLLHLGLCIYTATSEPTPSWEQMIIVDFPASFVIGALAWHVELAPLWFGVFGTLWWFFLSWAAWRLLRLLVGGRTTGV